MTEPKSVTFQAIFNKASTTVDGGWRITLDVSADEAKQVTDLSALRDRFLQVAIVEITDGAPE